MRVKNGTAVMPIANWNAATSQKPRSGHSSGFQTNFNSLSVNAFQDPEQQQNGGSNLKDGFRPRLDRSVSEHGEGDQNAYAGAYRAHVHGCREDRSQ